MRRLAACAILLASPIALLAANSSDGTPGTAHPGDDVWGNSVRSLRLAIALSSTSMNPGSDISYGVYMGNFGKETAWYISCSYAGTIYFGLNVIDAEGVAQKSNGRFVWGCSSNFPVSIKPGAIDLLGSGTIAHSWTLQAGSYTLRQRAETDSLAFGDVEGSKRSSPVSLGYLRAERHFTVTA
jgi:hypothetical protein